VLAWGSWFGLWLCLGLCLCLRFLLSVDSACLWLSPVLVLVLSVLVLEVVSCARKALAPAVEYGYVQIDNYAQQKAKGLVAGPKRWVPLPSGTEVLSYDAEELPLKIARESPCFGKDEGNTMRRVKSGSTIASSSEYNVHFCEEAEWIFVDRDICGVSLHEYVPCVAAQTDFVSSHFGFLFLQDLAELEAASRDEQDKVAASKTSLERHNQEERELDEALKLAGVVESLLTEAIPSEDKDEEDEEPLFKRNTWRQCLEA